MGCKAYFVILRIARFFVTPSDSVAIIAANAVASITYFSGGLKGVARCDIKFSSSMFAVVFRLGFLLPLLC